MTTQEKKMMDAIDVATTRVKDMLNATPTTQTTNVESTRATKTPMKRKQRQLFKDGNGKEGKRARTDPLTAAAERVTVLKKTKVLQATNKFKPMEEASEGEHGDEEESQSLLPENSQLLLKTPVASDDDGSNNDDDDDEDAANATIAAVFDSKGDEPTQLPSDDDEVTGMPEGTRVDVDLSGDSDNEDSTTQVEEDESFLDWVKSTGKRMAKKKDVKAFLKQEHKHYFQQWENCSWSNPFYRFISSLVTNGGVEGGYGNTGCHPDERGPDYFPSLMVIFIAEMLKNVNGKFTGIEKAYEEQKIIDPWVEDVKRFIEDNGEKKHANNKAVNQVVSQFFKLLNEHGQLDAMKKIYQTVYGEPEQEADEPVVSVTPIKDILETSLSSERAFDEANFNQEEEDYKPVQEQNILNFFPLTELFATVDEEKVKEKFLETNPKPCFLFDESISLEDEMVATYKSHLVALKKHEKEMEDALTKAYDKAASECFMTTLVKSTITILDCCKQKTEESWKMIKETIINLSDEFCDRYYASSDELQDQVQLGWKKMAFYQLVNQNKKCKHPEDQKTIASVCFITAVKKAKAKGTNDIFVRPIDARNNYHVLINQDEYHEKIQTLREKKHAAFPPSLLSSSAHDMSIEKRIDYLFAIFNFASLSYFFMDPNACHDMKYIDNAETSQAHPTRRLNKAFQMMAKAYGKN